MGKMGTYMLLRLRRACKLLTDYNQKILSFDSIYDYFALLKPFNTYTLNFHQYFKDKLYYFNISKTKKTNLLINHLICTTPETEK